MMDPLTVALDILFLVLAALALRGDYGLPAPPTLENGTDSIVTNSMTLTPTTSTPNSPLLSDGSCGVPSITITPESKGKTTRHRRKMVSFSLSSMDEVIPNDPKSKRPPTPWVSGPVSPNQRSPIPSLPNSPIAHSKDTEDPMGVKKQWLMVQ